MVCSKEAVITNDEETKSHPGMSRRALLAGGAGVVTASCFGKNAGAEGFPSAHPVVINQVGFLPGEPKRALIPLPRLLNDNRFSLVEEATGAACFSGELRTVPAKPGQDRLLTAEFDSFRRIGRYRVRLTDGSLSPPFAVEPHLYANLQPLLLKYFSVQQCGSQTSARRKPCHLDDGIVRGGPRNGQPFDATGGWHDAGDYLKFVETTSYVTALMLFAYELNPHSDSKTNVSSALPPLLSQAKIGLDWLLKMHPSPQEFYYQVGDRHDHDFWRLPEDDSHVKRKSWRPRPVLHGIGANLAGRTAAALAMASRLYRLFAPQFAMQCLASAQSVYRLGQQNPRVLSTTPRDFYAEESWKDDMQWGAAELHHATGKASYLRQALDLADDNDIADEPVSVYTTTSLAHFRLHAHAGVEDRHKVLGYLQRDAEKIASSSRSNPYGLATKYVWGTAATAAGAALTCLLYAKLTGDRAAGEAARWQRDYLLGCNPFGLSCVIGAGSRFPKHPHHQASSIGKFQLDGAMIAGPTSLAVLSGQDFSRDSLEYSVSRQSLHSRSQASVGVYHDSVRDFVINEPAIDYTAQFLLLSSFYALPI